MVSLALAHTIENPSEETLLALYAQAIGNGSAVYEVTRRGGIVGKLAYLTEETAVLIGPLCELLNSSQLFNLLYDIDAELRCIREPRIRNL